MMPPTRSRRQSRSVATAGVTRGAAALAGAGLTLPGARPPEIALTATEYGEKTMPNRILVAYASKAGSTAGVADAIGQTLVERGARVDVRQMKSVADLRPYDSVVAGSAIRGAKWLPEAMQFMETHQAALARKPFAAFLVCMTLAMKNGEKYRPHVATWLDPVRAMAKPVSTGLFAGVLNLGKISSFRARLKFRVSVLLGVWKEGDHRDWNAIREWAASLNPLLLQ